MKFLIYSGLCSLFFSSTALAVSNCPGKHLEINFLGDHQPEGGATTGSKKSAKIEIITRKVHNDYTKPENAITHRIVINEDDGFMLDMILKKLVKDTNSDTLNAHIRARLQKYDVYTHYRRDLTKRAAGTAESEARYGGLENPYDNRESKEFLDLSREAWNKYPNRDGALTDEERHDLVNGWFRRQLQRKKAEYSKYAINKKIEDFKLAFAKLDDTAKILADKSKPDSDRRAALREFDNILKGREFGISPTNFSYQRLDIKSGKMPFVQILGNGSNLIDDLKLGDLKDIKPHSTGRGYGCDALATLAPGSVERLIGKPEAAMGRTERRNNTKITR